MQASKEEQLLALLVLDDETGAKVAELDNTWVVMLTGPRFNGQYVYTGRFVLDEIAIKAGAGISERIPRADLLRYYVDHINQWTLKVMIDDYMNDALYGESHG